jgi:uncharacterized protein YkwD
VPEDVDVFTSVVTTTSTSTTTTLPVSEAVAWMEMRVHELVNAERTKAGLENLTWNPEVAAVARMHSMDMAENDYFDHTDLDGLNVSGRLKEGGIYYWNTSGENILKDSIVDYYMVDRSGRVLDTIYKGLDGFAKESVSAWMNSTGHRENILYEHYNEDGVGIAENGNNTYYFTQNFITRTDCGYYNGVCCPAHLPYLPWCYVPYRCRGSVCQ